MILSLILIIVGFFALIYGANWMVDGASALAKRFNVSDLVVGLTVVAFGTSAPELVVNSVAAADGLSDIILSNVIGSNNFNLFIILGISGLIYPIAVHSSIVRNEIPMSLSAAVILLLLGNDFFIGSNNIISRIDGLILFSLFGLFLYYVMSQPKAIPKVDATLVSKSLLNIVGLIILGLAGLVIGGKLVVDNSINVASEFGVSQKIIGLTIIAAGTSLPELITSAVAARKKNSDIAIGNVLGSNIFNILLVIAISSFISPIDYSQIFNQDLLILIVGSLFLISGILMGTKYVISRWQAGLLLLLYLSYTVYLVGQEL